MSQSERIGNRVVDVAVLGGSVAVRESACHVSAPNEPLERGRRPVSRFGCAHLARMTHQRNLRTAAIQLRQHWIG